MSELLKKILLQKLIPPLKQHNTHYNPLQLNKREVQLSLQLVIQFLQHFKFQKLLLRQLSMEAVLLPLRSMIKIQPLLRNLLLYRLPKHN